MSQENQATTYGNAAQAGYATIPQGGLPQYTEAWALIEAARRMAEATAAENAKEEMREALRLNWRLWTIFQVELTTGESDVPEDVRMNMLTLCKYIDQHTVGALAEPTMEKIEVLVNINRDIAGGLLDGLKRTVEEVENTHTLEHAGDEDAEQASAQLPISVDKSI